MKIKQLRSKNIDCMWRINEEGLPGVGQISPAAMADLLKLAIYPIGAFQDEQLIGFAICLPPKTRYVSPNYKWFNQRYKSFLYVDRIAVTTERRNQKVGSALYERVISEAARYKCPVTAEVNIDPPNPGSMRFHQRHGFVQVGTLEHKEYSVGMFFRSV